MAELFFNSRRVDGRRPHEIRKISTDLSCGTGDGSALLYQGNTQVLVSVFGPHLCNQKQSSSDTVITCSFHKPPFAAIAGDRRIQHSKDRIAADKASSIKEVFNNVIRCEKYPNSQIDIFIEVLQTDGSELSCAMNATTLALIDAGIEMFNFVVSTTVGMHGSHVFADLNRFEESSKMPQLTIVMVPNLSIAGEKETKEAENPTNAELDQAVKVLHCEMSCWVSSTEASHMLTEACQVASVIHNKLAADLKSHIAASSSSVVINSSKTTIPV